MKTIGKSLAVLDLFLTANGELSLDEVAKLSGINKSTTRRIVMSLMEYELLTQSPKRGKYTLGMKFLDFSQAIRKNTPIIDIADPFLTKLGGAIDETVALAIWNGRRAIICQSIHPNHPLKVSVFDGVMTQLHQTSLGKAIMAELPEKKLDAILTSELRRFTPNTLTDIGDLKGHLIMVQRNGVAVDDEEGYLGVRGIATAFKDEAGVVAGAITVLGPTIRVTRDKVKEYIPLVKECAQSISKALGYKGV